VIDERSWSHVGDWKESLDWVICKAIIGYIEKAQVYVSFEVYISELVFLRLFVVYLFTCLLDRAIYPVWQYMASSPR
jgi:hypothetical protein